MPETELKPKIDEQGRRVFDLTAFRGFFRRTNRGRVGDIIISGDKQYSVAPDGSFCRLNKKNRRRKNK